MGAKEFFSSIGNAIKTGVQKVTKSLPSIASSVIDGASSGGIMGAVSGGIKSIMSAVTGVSKSTPSQTVADSTSSTKTVSVASVAPVAERKPVSSTWVAYATVTDNLRRTI